MSDSGLTRLAVVTGDLAPTLSDDGQKLAAALENRGVDTEPVMWDDSGVNWKAYDGVLLRSCWEYPEDIDRFQTMLNEIDRADVPLANPLEAVRWNLHKSYMLDLEEHGVRIPPTTLVPNGSGTSLEMVLATQGWDEVVVKPSVGAMSTDVWQTTAENAEESASRFAEQVAENDVLVQKYVPEIATGERSIVFFDGRYSHSWNSRSTGDPTEFDGSEIDASYEAPAEQRKQAAAALETARRLLDIDRQRLPYARVDYVPRDGELVLIELELIEPSLGLDRGVGTVERFCASILDYFESRCNPA